MRQASSRAESQADHNIEKRAKYSNVFAVTLGWADSLLSTAARAASSGLDSTWMRSDCDNESLPCDRKKTIPSARKLRPQSLHVSLACLRHREGILANAHHILR